MPKVNSLDKVLEDEIKDLYNAENQLLKALPKMAKKASTPSLKEAFQHHLEETRGQVERLQKVGTLLDIKLTGKVCKAMQGLIEEGKEVLEEESDNKALIDVMLIGAAQRVEHYEIAGYGTARTIAQTLGHENIAQLLQETLDEESAADEKLTVISEGEVLPAANSSGTASEGNQKKEIAKKAKTAQR